MSAPKARLILKVETNHDAVIVTVKDKETRVTSVEGLESLPRVDLQRAFGVALQSKACQECAGVNTRTADPEQLRRAVRHALQVHHDGTYGWDSSKADNNEPLPLEPIRSSAETIDEPWADAQPIEPLPAPTRLEPEPQPQPAAASGSLDSMIRAMVNDAVLASLPTDAPTVDETAVRAIVDAALENVRRPIVVKLPDRAEPQPLPDAHHVKLPEVVRLLNAGLNVYLQGPAGTGKSTMLEQAASALELPFYFISCSPVTPESRMFGFIDGHGTYRGTPLREAFENGGVFCFDEIDKSHPGVLASINTVLANGHASFADGIVKKHSRNLIGATANTFGTGATTEYVGSNKLDAATLDRFTFVEVPIDEDLEARLAHAHHDNAAEVSDLLHRVRGIRERAQEHGLRVVVSPRASIDGARMLAAGFSAEYALESKVLRGLTVDQRAKVVTS